LRPLRISAAEQVARGVTTVAEVLSVLPPTDIEDDDSDFDFASPPPKQARRA